MTSLVMSSSLLVSVPHLPAIWWENPSCTEKWAPLYLRTTHVRPTTAPRPCGKRSAPSSKAPSTKDSGHLYTDANSVANYLLPTPSRSLPVVPHGPPDGVLSSSSSSRPLEVLQPQPKPPGYEQTKSIFARWIEKKNNAVKNLGKV